MNQPNKDRTTYPPGFTPEETRIKLIQEWNPKGNTILKFIIEESGHLSKAVLAEMSIVKKARLILETLNITTLNEIRIPVEKPGLQILDYSEGTASPTLANNFYIVHFRKYRKTDGSIYWKFKKIEE